MRNTEQITEQNTEQDKKLWKTPELKVHGDIVSLTQQAKTVGSADGSTFLGLNIGS